MKTIIKHGCLVKIEECNSCGCKFQYNIEQDIEVEHEMRYVTCPECEYKIEVK